MADRTASKKAHAPGSRKADSDHKDHVEIFEVEGPYHRTRPSKAFELRLGEPPEILARYESRGVRLNEAGEPDAYAEETFQLIETHTDGLCGTHPSKKGLTLALFTAAWEAAHELVESGRATGVWDRTRYSKEYKLRGS